MGLSIQPYASSLIPAVREFNRRLAAGGVPASFLFPESDLPDWLPKTGGGKIYQEFFLAVDGDAVRGAYILKHQPFSFAGRELSIAYYHWPISEGLVDPKYHMVGVQLLLDAVRRQPQLFALGMGGYEQPLPKLLRAVRWHLSSVPFYFKVMHPAAFLHNIQALRKTRMRRFALDLLAFSGLGWAGIRALNALGTRNGRYAQVKPVDEFGTWADEVWARSKSCCAMTAIRDSEALNILYPPENRRFLRLRIADAGRVLGWAVVLDTQMSGDIYFGDLRLGSIVDCWAEPGDAAAVIAGAAGVLRELGVDLVITNQSHAAWGAALEHTGFRQGPSNFLFGASERLAELVAPLEEKRTQLHLTRGDGDGPIHL